MNRLQSWFRGCVRASWLLVLFVVLGVIGLLGMAFSTVADWFSAPEREKRDPIITPVEDHQVPAYLQPVIAIRREAALARNYRGPIAWYFRGGITLKDIVAEFGNARIAKWIFDQQTGGIWPDQQMIVFWVPTETFSNTADPDPADLKKELGLPERHSMSIGRVLMLYLLLLRHRQLFGRSALSQGSWLMTETFCEGRRVLLGYHDWFGYRIDTRGDGIANEHLGFFMLGIEYAHDFYLPKQAH